MKKHRAILGAPFLGVGLAAFMLAALLPIPEAAATKYTDTACEGQELEFWAQRPRQDINYDGNLTYKIRITGGSATEGQDYWTPVGSLTFKGKSTEHFNVQTLEDHVAEDDETVRLELYEPHTGAWIQRYGIWVQPEALMPETISFRGTIRDWANAERQGAWKRAGTVWYDC